MKSFTLIEVLTAVFVLAVGIVTLLAMFPLGIKVENSAQMASLATSLAQVKMEEIISLPYGEISSSAEDYGTIPDFNSYKRVTEVFCYDPNEPGSPPDCPDSGIKKIEVAVFWQSVFGAEKSIKLTSLIAKR